MTLPQLYSAALTYPAIDNHAHPLLKEQHRSVLPFEGLVSEAQGEALVNDAPHTLACLRATRQLARLYRLPKPEQDQGGAAWDDIKSARDKLGYDELCRMCMEPARIQCILLDDGLGGAAELAEGLAWHDRFATSPARRLVRIETLAEELIGQMADSGDAPAALGTFARMLAAALSASATDPSVAGFKSIVCYRTGLDVSPTVPEHDAPLSAAFEAALDMYRTAGTLRLAHKLLNDYVVHVTLDVAGKHGIPVQFHTGLGDNDLSLDTASPSKLQPLIKAYPSTTIVLLHSSYPFTREAGYLTAVYSNVFLDFGEVFPFLSADGQRSVIRQILELCPTNKIMWSTDGHWWPESYYLGSFQARLALYEVLSEMVRHEDLTEAQAMTIICNALFHNANRVYKLGLEPIL